MTKDEKNIQFSSEKNHDSNDLTKQNNHLEKKKSKKSSDENISLEELFLRA